MTKKTGFLLGLAAVILLCGGYVLCRFVLLSLHGMHQWPMMLFLAGLVVLAVEAVCRKPIAMLLTGAGYLISFFLGVLFQRDGVDPGGGSTNNLWIIWTAAYAVILLAAPVVEVLLRRRTKSE